jgi:N-acetylglucosamine kinase-like BadF-type ATPase
VKKEAESVRYVLGIDAGGTKTRALLADENAHIVGGALGGGANLRTHGELEVEKVLHAVIEEAAAAAEARPAAVALGIAGADRPQDEAVLRGILRRIGFRDRVVVTNDARIAFVAGSERRVGLALVCGTGSIAWGRNRAGEVARSGGWGWHLGDEGSGFWIGERAIREVLRAADGRGPATSLDRALSEHFEIARPEQILYAIYDREFPRTRVAKFASLVEQAALAGDGVAKAILADAAGELVRAAASVRDRLRLEEEPYDVVLSGGTFAAVPTLEREVGRRLATANAHVRKLTEEPAMGAVKLAIEALDSASPGGGAG